MRGPLTPFKFFVWLCAGTLGLAFVVAIAVYFTVAGHLPSLEQLENPKQNFATQILSADGKLLDHFFIQRRVSLSLDSIPKDFQNALVAVEDKEFYDHWGIHTARVMNAAIKNIFRKASGRRGEGASTITMQLARNLYFTQEGTWKRKIREAVTAINIEKAFTKDEILQMYANTVNFGRGAYGVQVAAQVYFDKPPMQLSTAECAFLVGLLKAPEIYNGISDYPKALERRNLVLRMMRDQGKITETTYAKSLQEPINLAKFKDQRKAPLAAPHFVEMIRQDLSKNMKEFDIYRDGLIIHTTLNSRIQQYAEEAVAEHLEKFQAVFNKSWSWSRNTELLNTLINKAIKDNPAYNSAPTDKREAIADELRYKREFVDSVKNAATTVQVGLVVIDPTNGAILAMVGASPKFLQESPDAKYSLNHVTRINRQPGSTFKPFVYSAALMKGLTPSSTIESGPYTYTMPSGESWSPRGSGKNEGGMVSLSQALAGSINTVSARLITTVTSPTEVIELARKMGIESNLNAVPALSLGAGGEVRPMEMTSAFGTFINDGIHVKPYYVNSIDDQFGTAIFEKNGATEATDALPPKIARQMAMMMQGVINYGTAWGIKKLLPPGLECGGKTGTTNDYADAWFIGFSPQLVAGVWVGFDDRRITFTGSYAYAASAAAPVWGLLMKKIYSDERLPYKQRKFAFNMVDSSATGGFFNDEGDDPYSAELQRMPSTEQIKSDDTPAKKPEPIENKKDTKKDQPEKKATFPKLNQNAGTDQKKKARII